MLDSFDAHAGPVIPHSDSEGASPVTLWYASRSMATSQQMF